MYKNWGFEKLFETAGTRYVPMSNGEYYFRLRGGGGAGGGGGTDDRSSGGAGGAGGIGQLVNTKINIQGNCVATIVVGVGGTTSGGNGGNGGSGNGSNAGGNGGGGGMPSYVLINQQTIVETYYGWTYASNDSGIYVGPTRTYYVTYDNPASIYISETPMTYTWGSFVLTNGTTYTNGQQLFYASDSATIRITLDITNGSVRLVGTATNAFDATVTPLDVTSDFIGGYALTQTGTPRVGDDVFDRDFQYIGEITDINGDMFVFNANTYSRYPAIDTSRTVEAASQIIPAQGGAGGGGGGGSGKYGRNVSNGGGGGGGGLYYIDDTAQITNIPGKTGGAGLNGNISAAGAAGIEGNTGMFGDTIFSGRGGTAGHSGNYYGQNGGAGKTGGGASGGSGATYEGHGSTSTGGGGGGAGGDLDAGGGQRGVGGYLDNSTDAYNTHTEPTPSTNYLGQTSNLGMGGTGGTSDQPPTNGYNGWVYIYKFEPTTSINNLGPVLVTTTSNIVDDGNVSDTATTMVDNGEITGTVSESIDDGSIFVSPELTIQNLGSVTDPVTLTINNGGI